jgi:outer membrane protein TolC
MKKWNQLTSLAICVFTFHFIFVSTLQSQEKIQLTLESAIEIMMSNSYTIKNLEMGIVQQRFQLQAERAGLKSSASMNLQIPTLNRTADYKWNSTLQRDEIVRLNTNRYQMSFSIRQPVILYKYPTNGNISLNYNVYQYNQAGNKKTTNYYNRLYLQFDQPLFIPNGKKNDYEEAQLDLESTELSYISSQLEIISDISDDYFSLFELAYSILIYENNIRNLSRIDSLVDAIIRQDTSRAFEKKQVAVELVNARERLMGNRSELRTDLASIKQRLRLPENTVLEIIPTVKITPISVDPEQALRYGYELRPSIRFKEIDRRRTEFNLEYVKSNNWFRGNLSMTYGLEKQDNRYQTLWNQTLWNQYDNSNSVSFTLYVPVWDWGRRKSSIEVSKISLLKNDLSMQNLKESIRTEIYNAVTNLNEYQTRAIAMQQSVSNAIELFESSLEIYQRGAMPLQYLLQILNSQRETELNFLNVYCDYKDSIRSLMMRTYYDFENNISVIDKFKARNSQNLQRTKN